MHHNAWFGLRACAPLSKFRDFRENFAESGSGGPARAPDGYSGAPFWSGVVAHTYSRCTMGENSWPFLRSMAAQPWERREKRHRRCGKPTPLLTGLSCRHAACLHDKLCPMPTAAAAEEICFLRPFQVRRAQAGEVITSSSTRWPLENVNVKAKA